MKTGKAIVNFILIVTFACSSVCFLCAFGVI